MKLPNVRAISAAKNPNFIGPVMRMIGHAFQTHFKITKRAETVSLSKFTREWKHVVENLHHGNERYQTITIINGKS